MRWCSDQPRPDPPTGISLMPGFVTTCHDRPPELACSTRALGRHGRSCFGGLSSIKWITGRRDESGSVQCSGAGTSGANGAFVPQGRMTGSGERNAGESWNGDGSWNSPSKPIHLNAWVSDAGGSPHPASELDLTYYALTCWPSHRQGVRSCASPSSAGPQATRQRLGHCREVAPPPSQQEPHSLRVHGSIEREPHGSD